MNDSLFKNARVCYDQVLVKDDSDERVLGQARWNETLVSFPDGTRMPAWKWQLWVETRGEVEVRTADGTLRGFIWPRKS
jgi:hypothetical protein